MSTGVGNLPNIGIACSYSFERYPDGRRVYVCKIEHKWLSLISSVNPTLNLQGDHEPGKANNNVQEVRFVKCIMQNVPQGLTKIFPNMVDLSIWNSNLNKITRSDLIEYKNLERFGFCENQTEYLSSDLFEGFDNLEEIIFNRNQLQTIEPDILDGLKRLKIVNFKSNPNYSRCYSVYPEYFPNATLEEVKEELFEKFYSEVPENAKAYIKRLQNKMQELELQRYHDEVCRNITKYQQNDLKVVVENREICVHKELFAAKSQAIAEALEKNPNSGVLILEGIPLDTFQVILKFIYSDVLPTESTTSYKQLFEASSKLRIEKLRKLAADKLWKEIYPGNALEIFNFAVKYEHVDLQKKAYTIFHEKHPFTEITDSWGMKLTWPEARIKCTCSGLRF